MDRGLHLNPMHSSTTREITWIFLIIVSIATCDIIVLFYMRLFQVFKWRSVSCICTAGKGSWSKMFCSIRYSTLWSAQQHPLLIILSAFENRNLSDKLAYRSILHERAQLCFYAIHDPKEDASVECIGIQYVQQPDKLVANHAITICLCSLYIAMR